MPERSTSLACGWFLGAALLGCAVSCYLFWGERSKDQALTLELQVVRQERDDLSGKVQSLEGQLQKTSNRLSDLRKQGLKIYTLELAVTFSVVAVRAPQQVNLAAVVTLSNSDGTSYRLTNPDMTAAVEGDHLKMLFEPEDPSVLVGHEISTLVKTTTLQTNIAALFKLADIELREDAQLSYELHVNGVTVLTGAGIQASTVQGGSLSIGVAKEFSAVERRYAEAIGLTEQH